MSKFEELLNQPLPSAIMGGESEPMFESFNEFDIDDISFDTEDTQGEGLDKPMSGGSDSKTSLDKALEEGNCAKEGNSGECGDGEDGCGDDCKYQLPMTVPGLDNPIQMTMPNTTDVEVDVVPTPVEEPEGEPAPLPPEAEKKVDNIMDTVGTKILIANEFSNKELEDFTESMDVDILEKEGFFTERTIIKFDKYARRAQLYEVAVAACAREHKDPLYKKLQTAYKIERTIKARLRRKYHGEANRKVKEYLARARKSKSGILSRIAAKLSGSNKK